VLEIMDALHVDRAGLVGHSQSGNFAVNLALARPERVSGVMVLGTGSLLPPLDTDDTPIGAPADENVFGREPTRDDIRRVLEHQLYNHSLITPELIELRYQMSLGHHREPPAPRVVGPGQNVPLWQRLGEVEVPMVLLYGRDDRPTTEQQVNLLRARLPRLKVRLLENCKHLIQIDRADEFQATAAEFFPSVVRA
jgi:2-hydroxy-6-oxonona-2,4-dienedioate hydrolase